MKTTYEIQEIVYNRNGVGGVPFFSIRFKLTEGKTKNELLMTVPDPIADNSNINCCVINPNDLQNKWRGDVIGNDILSEFKKFGYDTDFTGLLLPIKIVSVK